MTSFLRTLFVGAAFAALATAVWSQPVGQNALSGNECWNAGQGPGGPSTGFLCVNTVRNGAAILSVSGSGSATTTGTQANSTYAWTSTAPTTWTFTFPNPAIDGQIVTLTSDTTLTTMVTTSVTTSPQNQTQAGALSGSTITANTSNEWQFSLAQLKWYKLR